MRNVFWSGLLTAVVGLLTTGAGCGSSAPSPDEVSVESSGVSIGPGPDLADQWPMWRGPSTDGLAPDQPLPTSWDEDEGVLWRVDVPGRGHSSPVVVDDLVLLATADAKAETQSVLAYDRQTGESRWRTDVHQGKLPPARQVHNKATHANGTVACDGERVYVTFFNDGKITATALDMEGQEVWRQQLGAFESKFGYAPSPILYKSLLIVNVDTHGGFLCALDGKTGKVAWRVARPSEHTYSSPMVANVGGKDQLLISGASRVISYDPVTGEENWSTPCTADSTCGTVVALDDRLFASGGYPQKETVCLSAKGEKLWSDKAHAYEPSLLATNGCLFCVSDGGVATCWSAEDGGELWRQRLSGSFSASAVCCNDTIYVPNLSGQTYVFAASGEGYQEQAINQLGDDCYASPAIHQGRIYLRVGVGSGGARQEQLCCIGEPSQP